VVFPSFEFAFFFPLVLALSWLLMPRPHLWKPFVLAASYVFYAAASPRYALLLAGVTLANQAGAVLVGRASEERTRKRIMAATVVVDLGVLGLFKYYGFFAGEIGAFLDSLGLGMPLPLLVIEHQLRGRVRAPAWIRWAIVFNIVVFGWILFRAESLELAATFLSRLFEPGPATLFTPAVVGAVVVVIGFQLLPPDPLERLRIRLAALPAPSLGLGLALVVALVGATVPSQGVPPFIYFQF
jgi:D-alanyl-lipoteichoic acid acyltransferase DltB (MBOAT superfamily)